MELFITFHHHVIEVLNGPIVLFFHNQLKSGLRRLRFLGLSGQARCGRRNCPFVRIFRAAVPSFSLLVPQTTITTTCTLPLPFTAVWVAVWVIVKGRITLTMVWVTLGPPRRSPSHILLSPWSIKREPKNQDGTLRLLLQQITDKP